MKKPASTASARAFLVMAGVVTVILWQVPYYGERILYPFTLFATYAHEMGHGLMATALGATFASLVMYPDGSGFALWQGYTGMSRISYALVAAGGLVGPSVTGALLLVASRQPSRSRTILIGLGLFMLMTALWVAEQPFTLFFVVFVGSSLLLIGLRFPLSTTTFLVQLIGVQLCVALFRDIRYMFSSGGTVGGQTHVSDTTVMEQALFLPYWVWGGITAIFSGAVLVLGLWVALRDPGQRPKGRSVP